MASIFVVEDEEIIRCVLEKNLGERHRVYSFATAEECLAVWRGRVPRPVADPGVQSTR